MMYQKSTAWLVLLLRLSLGWYFFYAGVSKIINPAWSAEGFLKAAKTFHNFYNFFLDPGVLPYVNLLNKWGLAIIGLSLILGLFVRWSALAGVLLMALYYFPGLDFPYAGDNALVVDQHVIFALLFLFLAAAGAGRKWGFDRRLDR
jgi:thiosulfate dehydrogenase [quinone] large subunit